MSYLFVSPTILDSGIGAVEKVGTYLNGFEAEKILIITDSGLVKTGLVDEVVDLIEDAGMDVAVFDGVLPDPPDIMIDKAIEMAREEEVDALVSIGGGSSIDTAKAVAVSMSRPEGFRAYFGKFNAIPGPMMPHIAIPTTAGTGSEVSAVSVVSITSEERKGALLAPSICPTVALVDAKMTASLPPHITAATGADALTHLMETCTSTTQSPLADGIALEGTRILVKNLPLALEDGSNLEIRQLIADASTMGAVAFSIGMFHLPHCFSHAIGGKWHIPHGIGCAWGLVYAIEYIADLIPDKIRDFSNIFGVEGYRTRPIEELKVDLKDAMIAFFESINIPRIGTFKNANREEFDLIVDACEFEMKTNFSPYTPKQPDRAYFYHVLEQSF